MRLWNMNKRFKGAAIWMLLILTLWITGCTRGGRVDNPQASAVASTAVSEEVASITASTAVREEVVSAVASTSASEEIASTVATTAASEEIVSTAATTAESEEISPSLDEDGVYTSKDDVAAYISFYGKLPSNFITKKEAKKLGWPGGSLEKYAPGKCIGGDYFGNYEGLLPTKKGRKYYECDIDTLGKSKRGAKRIIYSNDGLIYYTGDHYESFELLYGEP